MKICEILLAPGNGAFFYDDQAAIRAGAPADGFVYSGVPLTPGFTAIRMPAAALSIGLVLSDGEVAWGDMMSVQYSGAAGRDPLFDSEQLATVIRSVVAPRLVRCDPADFLAACADVLAPHEGQRLPLALQYGVSQALLRAAAHVTRRTMAEVICTAFRLEVPRARVPLFAQSGDAREINVDKMILKSVDILPQGLINSREKFGARGEVFRDFVRWVARRTQQIGAPGYRPILHFDVYGWIGYAFGLDPEKIADFIARVADDVPEFLLNVECPADFGSAPAQIEGYAAIVRALARRGSTARIVADERCNTLDEITQFAAAKAAHLIQIKMPDVGSVADSAAAVIACKRYGVGAYLGGSCSETDLSARASVHIGVATQADMLLAKPGMGVDEGLSIVGNEQSRLLAILASRSRTAQAFAGAAE